MPVYNTEKYLKEAIDSVLNQSFKDFELICINDGSTDNSPEILENYKKKDKRIKIINQKNQGLGAARNKGLKNSNGEFIFFIDSDDYIAENALENLYKNAILNDSDMVLYKMARFNWDNIWYNAPIFDFDEINPKIDFSNYTFNYKEIKSHVLNKSFSACIKLYKKEFLDKYDDFYFDTGLIFEDVPFHVKVMLRSKKISYVPEYLYYYRQNPNSIINTNKNREDIYKIIDIVEKFLRENNYYDELKYEFEYFKVLQILQYILEANTEEYFNKAKSELKKVDISKNELIPINISELYDLIFDCNYFTEFKLKIENNSLKNDNNALLKENNSLKNDNNALLKENNSLKNDNNILLDRNKNLEKENNTLLKENKNLENKNKSLNNEMIKLLNSRSWKITKPLRRIKKSIK